MSPGTDAMGFINGEKRNLAPLEKIEHFFGTKSFRGDVKEFELTASNGIRHILTLGEAHGTIDAGRSDAAFGERIDLILHQGNQG